MPIDRTTIIAGPAIVQYGAYNFYTEGDITVSLELKTVAKNVSIYGKVDEVSDDRFCEVSFTPTMLEESSLAVLWPYGSTLIGADIFGASDTALTIWTTAGKKITFDAAAVTKCPSLFLNASKHPLGQMTFLVIGKNNTAWSAADSFGAVTAVAWEDPADLVLASILNDEFSAAWATSGAWSSFVTEEGWTLDCEVATKSFAVDTAGTVKVILSGLEVRAKCKPVGVASGIAEAELLAGVNFQGTGAGRGKSLNGMSNTHDLVITGAKAAAATPKQHLVATVKAAALKTAGMAFGREVLRNGEVGWVATRSISGATVSALYTLALT